MAVNYQKIRVGAPDSMVLDQGLAGAIDLGASVGGAVFGYNATYLPIEIDQAIMPVNAYKTKEDILFSVSVVQEQSSIMLAALSLGTDLLTTTVAGTLASVSPAPTLVVNAGGAAVTYTYTVIAFDGNGDAIPSPVATTAIGPTTLSATNSITLNWTAVAGALGYKIQRTAGGTSQGIIGQTGTGTLTFTDTGLAATAYTVSGTNPALANTDQMFFGGRLAVPFHAFDWSVPKNDGTTNHWRGHLNRCFSSKAVSLDYKRDKVSEVAKIELMALADTTQAVGRQGGWLIEEY